MVGQQDGAETANDPMIEWVSQGQQGWKGCAIEVINVVAFLGIIVGNAFMIVQHNELELRELAPQPRTCIHADDGGSGRDVDCLNVTLVVPGSSQIAGLAHLDVFQRDADKSEWHVHDHRGAWELPRWMPTMTTWRWLSLQIVLTSDKTNTTIYLGYCGQVAIMESQQDHPSAEDWRFFLSAGDGSSVNITSMGHMPKSCVTLVQTDIANFALAHDCAAWCESRWSPTFLRSAACTALPYPSWSRNVSDFHKARNKATTSLLFHVLFPSWQYQTALALSYALMGLAIARGKIARKAIDGEEGKAQPPSASDRNFEHLDMPCCCFRSASDQWRAKMQLVLSAPGALGDNPTDLLGLLGFLVQGQPYWAVGTLVAMIPVLITDIFQVNAFVAFLESWAQGFPTLGYMEHQASEGSREAPLGGMIAMLALMMAQPDGLTWSTFLVRMLSAVSAIVLAMPAAAVADVVVHQSQIDEKVLLNYRNLEVAKGRVPPELKFWSSLLVLKGGTVVVSCWAEVPWLTAWMLYIRICPILPPLSRVLAQLYGRKPKGRRVGLVEVAKPNYGCNATAARTLGRILGPLPLPLLILAFLPALASARGRLLDAVLMRCSLIAQLWAPSDEVQETPFVLHACTAAVQLLLLAAGCAAEVLEYCSLWDPSLHWRCYEVIMAETRAEMERRGDVEASSGHSSSGQEDGSSVQEDSSSDQDAQEDSSSDSSMREGLLE